LVKQKYFDICHYTNITLVQQKKEEDIVNSGIYVSILFTTLTFGPLLITHLNNPLPGVTVLHENFVKQLTQLTLLKVHTVIN